MTKRLFYVVALVVIAFGFMSSPPEAQTVATGPYYAVPSWNQKIPCPTLANCPRFVVLANWNSAAVLDRETGLVWERAPGAKSVPLALFEQAERSCRFNNVSGRSGWRVPTIEELQTLIDADTGGGLPPGHPFTDVEQATNEFYWSATRTVDDPKTVWVVSFGGVTSGAAINTFIFDFVWCVRGGSGVEPM